MYLHIALMKLSNCCVERSQMLFSWIFDIQTAHTYLYTVDCHIAYR